MENYLINLNKPVGVEEKVTVGVICKLTKKKANPLGFQHKIVYSGCLVLVISQGNCKNFFSQILFQDFILLICPKHRKKFSTKIFKIRNNPTKFFLFSSLNRTNISKSLGNLIQIKKKSLASYNHNFQQVIKISLGELKEKSSIIYFLEALEKKIFFLEMRKIRHGSLTEKDRHFYIQDISDAFWLLNLKKNSKIISELMIPINILFYNYKRIIIRLSSLKTISYGFQLSLFDMKRVQNGIEFGEKIILLSPNGDSVGIGQIYFNRSHLKNFPNQIIAKIRAVFISRAKIQQKKNFIFSSLKKKMLLSTGLPLKII
mmetsp:Transcript_43610/g.68280  ORF Transcript_43610/g.68280 Transcript_43610/m.68280 type:complete len:316 (+) Transcript_43610:1774-2721(+)